MHIYMYIHVRVTDMSFQYGPVQFGLVTINSPGLTYRQACTYYPVTCDASRVVQWLKEMRLVKLISCWLEFRETLLLEKIKRVVKCFNAKISHCMMVHVYTHVFVNLGGKVREISREPRYFAVPHVIALYRGISRLFSRETNEPASPARCRRNHAVSLGIMKALKCKTLGVSAMYIRIIHTRQYTCTYADKCVNVRGSIRKFGTDKSSEKYM